MARVEMPNSLARSAIANRSRLSLSGLFTACPLHCLVLLAQLLLGKLADECLWQLVLEDDLARHFKLVELVLEKFLQLPLCCGHVRLELDEGDGDFAAARVLSTDHADFVYRFMG